MYSMSTFTKLIPKNVLLLSNTPEETCKCQTHENLFLKLEAMGHSYDNSFWGVVLCDTSESSNFWLSKCDECREKKKFIPKKRIDSLAIYKQWKTIHVLANRKGSKNDEDKEPRFYQKLQIISEQVTVGEVYEDFQQPFEGVAAHVNLKQIQADAFQNDINDVDTRILQIDDAMAYQCQQQSKVQSALWTRGSINLFTCAMYHKDQTKTFLICTDYKGKDKFSNGTFLEHLYENELLNDGEGLNEVIWSDGPTAEFKNKFTKQLIQNLSLKCNKPFTWKFSATSHGKGVVDTVGGKVKSTIQCKVMSQGKNHLIVQDTESFASAAKKLISSTKIIHIGEPEIVTYKDRNPFEGGIEVKGISKMHVMEVDGEKTSLWKNCALKANS